MPWPITLYESREAARIAGNGKVQTGAMWPAEIDEGVTVDQWCEWYGSLVARRYVRENKANRPPMFVKLPDGTDFCIDFCSSPEAANGGGEGWGCAGAPPNVTLSPSVHIIGRYHGWIQNGVITDDCEGRRFP